MILYEANTQGDGDVVDAPVEEPRSRLLAAAQRLILARLMMHQATRSVRDCLVRGGGCWLKIMEKKDFGCWQVQPNGFVGVPSLPKEREQRRDWLSSGCTKKQ